MRLRTLFALGVLGSLLLPATAKAAVTPGGPWVAKVDGVGLVDGSTWLANGWRRGVFRSTDAGRSWTAVTGLLTGPTDYSSVVGAVGASGQTAVTGVQRVDLTKSPPANRVEILVSRDGGASWTPTPTPIANADAPPEAIRIDPSNPNRFTVVLAPGSQGNRTLLVTDDGGASWRTTNDIWSAGYIENAVYLADGSLTTGRDRSTDGGLTWGERSATVAGSGDPMNFVQAVALHPDGSLIGIADLPMGDPEWTDACPAITTNAGAPYSSPRDGIWRSTDFGSTWTKLSSTCALNDTQAEYSTGNPNPLKLGIGGSRLINPRVDGRVVMVDLQTGADITVEIDPGVRPALANSAGGVAVFPTNRGVLVSDGTTAEMRSRGIESLTWTTAISVNPADRNTMFTYSNGGSYRTTDGGATWSSVARALGTSAGWERSPSVPTFAPGGSVASTMAEAPFRLVPAAGGCSVRAEGVEFFRSDNAGATWQKRATLDGWAIGGSIAHADASRAYAPLSGAIVWTCTPNGGGGGSPSPTCGVARTDDGFASVTAFPIPGGCGSFSALAADPTNRDVVLALLDRRRVVRSQDGGQTWTDARAPGLPLIPGNVPTSIDFSPVRPGTVFLWASGQTRLCRSADAGANFTCGALPWANDLAGLPSGLQLASLGLNADGSIVAAIAAKIWDSTGVKKTYFVRSTDNGETWTASDGSPLPPVNVILDAVTGTSRQLGRRAEATARTPRAAARRSLLLGTTGIDTKTVQFTNRATGAVIVSRSLRLLANGRVAIRLTCKVAPTKAKRKPKNCEGALQVRAPVKKGKRTSSVTSSKVRFTIAAKKSATVTVVFPKAATTALRKGAKRVNATVVRWPTARAKGAGRSFTVPLRTR